MENSKHNEIQNRVSLYFDNALADSEKQELLSQVDCDPKCSKIFQKEQNYRNFIKNNITRPTVSSDLIKSIKDSINIR
jgi:hypothetical protein